MVKRRFRVRVKGDWHTVEVEDPQRYPFQITVDGEPLAVEVYAEEADLAAEEAPPEAPQVGEPVGLRGISQEGDKLIRCPMPGRIVAVSVKVWDEVKPGTELCILETMKMEQSIRAAHTGIVRAVFVHSGKNIAVGDPLIQLE
ncbi:MAG: biotin attachment protein [Chloroflexi bacterium]|nr:biotin attachment protein [Chloroflexota bacterium]